MNTVDRLDQAIQVMERVRDTHHNLDMTKYINEVTCPVTDDELTEENAPCGTAACFAGWFAMSPEGRALGLRVHKFTPPGLDWAGNPCRPRWQVSMVDMTPENPNFTEEEAIAEALQISLGDAKNLCLEESFYGTSALEHVTADDVIEGLHELKAEYARS